MNANARLKPAAELVAAARAHVETCSPHEAARRLAADGACMILDVREPGEHEKASIDGAVNIPRGVLEFKISQVCDDPDRPILVHCATGGRAVLAAKALSELGYRQVAVIDASFDDVAAALGARPA